MHIVKNFQITKSVKIGLVMAVLLNLALLGNANSPSEIQLTYDQEKGRLHVVVKHVSTHMRKHYIRKIEVRKNNEPSVPYYYTSQTSPSELIVDIALKAVPTDTIHVEAICSQAGRAEETLVIPAE